MKRVAISACLTMLALPVGAQATTAATDSGSTTCLVLNGIRIGADWGDSTNGSRARSDSSNRAGGFQLRGTTVDTTLTFDVAEQSWSRSSLRAYVAGGVSGRARNAATAGNPRAGWYACAGITLGMQQPTLVMRGVHGQMHLKVDLTPLTRLPGATLDSLRQNQIRR
jgi:hypothetical protein